MKISWNKPGERKFEQGVDRGVLYLPDVTGAYNTGVAWNGLVSVTESPSGAEPNKQYADNRPYVVLTSAEEFAATIEAFSYPDEFGECDGTAQPKPGVRVGQQRRKPFGMSYRTLIGNDLDSKAGFEIHMVWGAMAAPSEKAHTTINDSPEAMTLSWEVSTTPLDVEGLDPTATITVSSLDVSEEDMESLLVLLYGDTTSEPELPSPDDVLALFSSTPPVTP